MLSKYSTANCGQKRKQLTHFDPKNVSLDILLSISPPWLLISIVKLTFNVFFTLYVIFVDIYITGPNIIYTGEAELS
jgi:hypothetical protein